MREQRWTDKIIIEDMVEGERDVWGHKAEPKYVAIGERWAHVVPQLTPTTQALVRVQTPFKLTETARIKWNDQYWRIISGPINIPDNLQLAQFKMKEVCE